MIGYASGQDGAILPARDCPFCSRNNVSPKSKRVHESFLPQNIFRDSKYFPVHKNAKREPGQYPAILTPRLVNNIYMYLLKTELRILDFQHFHWLAGHRLSAHIPALPNMVNESINKESWTKLAATENRLAAELRSRNAGT